MSWVRYRSKGPLLAKDAGAKYAQYVSMFLANPGNGRIAAGCRLLNPEMAA
jgi:hypothetical protein